MKKGINFIQIAILVLVIILGGTACMKNPEEIESSSVSIGSSQSSKISNPTAIEYTDKQIINAILTEYNKYSKEDGAKYADIAVTQAEKLTNRYLGSVISEEDVKEKAEAVWMEIDKGLFKNIKEKFESGKQPYIEAFFYEKYDVWYLRTPLSGITKDGKSFGLTGGFRIIIRNSDGKVLGVW